MTRRLIERGFAACVATGAMMWPSIASGQQGPEFPGAPPAQQVPAEQAADQATSAKRQASGNQAAILVRPPPLNVDYLQFGAAFHFLFALDPGAVCPADAEVPCILGSGGGLSGRAGYRSRGPWYVGGAYSLARLDTSGLMRLGVLQQLTGEMRYLLNLGQRTEPYVTSGAGGVVFGNEWGAEAWGLTTFGGAGFEVQLSRTTVVGMVATYRPILFFEWTDRAGQERDLGIAHFWGLAITMEAREALGSHSARER